MKFNLFKRKNKEAEKRDLNYISFSLPSPKLELQVSPLALSALFRGVMLISDAVSTLPCSVKKKFEGNISTVYDHPLTAIFNDKNPESNLTWQQTLKMLVQESILKGNAYLYIYRNNDGSVKKLRFLRNDQVIIEYNDVKDQLYYKCSYVSKTRIEPCNMIHIKKFSYDGISGISLIKMMWRTLKIGTSAEENALATFSGGGAKIGYIKSSVPISAEQKNQIVSDWNQAYSGPSGSDYSRVAVLGHNLEYQSISSSAEETELLSTRQFTVDEIARFLGINPTLLGDLSHSSYNTLEASLLAFLSQTISPWVHLIEKELSKKLFRPSEADLYVDMDDYSLVLSDKSTLANYYNTLVSGGILSINEAREALDYSKREGADDLYIAYTDLAQNTVGNEQTPQEDISE